MDENCDYDSISPVPSQHHTLQNEFIRAAACLYEPTIDNIDSTDHTAHQCNTTANNNIVTRTTGLTSNSDDNSITQPIPSHINNYHLITNIIELYVKTN